MEPWCLILSLRLPSLNVRRMRRRWCGGPCSRCTTRQIFRGGMTNQKFTIKQACQMMKIGRSTLFRAVKAGKIRVEHDDSKLAYGKPTVTVSLAEIGRYLGICDEGKLRSRLGLPHLSPSAPSTAVATVRDISQPDAFSPHWTDSFGNKLTGNERHKIFDSAERQPLSTTEHMMPGTVTEMTEHNPVDSDEFMELWHPGHIARMKAMKAGNPAEQVRKVQQDQRAIAAAWQKGFSR